MPPVAMIKFFPGLINPPELVRPGTGQFSQSSIGAGPVDMTLANSTRDSPSRGGCFVIIARNIELMLMQDEISSKIKQKSKLIELDQ